MKIQEVIRELSNMVMRLSDVKMEIVKKTITSEEAKMRCAIILERGLQSKTLQKAIVEWKQ